MKIAAKLKTCELAPSGLGVPLVALLLQHEGRGPSEAPGLLASCISMAPDAQVASAAHLAALGRAYSQEVSLQLSLWRHRDLPGRLWAKGCGELILASNFLPHVTRLLNEDGLYGLDLLSNDVDLL